MSVLPCHSRPRTGGFTLIEVIAAMVIFALGVLMVIDLNASLAERMAYAARTSTIVVRAHERLDSLESMPFDSLSTGVTTDTLTIDGRPYQATTNVELITALLYTVNVTLAPVASGEGPSYTALSYVARPW